MTSVACQRKYFISFADSRMRAATQRIAKQAEEMNFFDEIHVMNEDALEPEFCSQWQHIMKFGVRGFGYWCWKPYIILRLLEKMPENAVLLYCDAGCHLNPKGIERLQFYVDELNADPLGIKAFCAFCNYTEVTEKKWTKGDALDYFNCRHRKDVTDSPQMAATQIFLRKGSASMEFVREWNRIFCEQFSLIDDSPSKSPNLPGFIENRHDQTIFSLMYKLRGGTPLPSGETDAADYSDMGDYPIWNVRDRGYKDMRFFARLKRFIKARIHMSKVRIENLKDRFFRTE